MQHRVGSFERPITRRQWICRAGHALGTAALAGAAGCSVGRRRGPAANTVTVLYPADEWVLGPEWDMSAQLMVFLPLAVTNRRGELEGRLAERWEHSADFRKWTIRLRDDIRWHDGAPVTAHDIKFTLDLLAHPDVLYYSPDAYQAKLVDDLTYTVTCRQYACTGIPLDDWRTYYPKHLLSKLDPKGFYGWDFWKHPVGNGPFRHVRTVDRTMIELEANPDYFRGRPKIKKVILKFAGTRAVPELESGTVDAAIWVNRADVLKLAGDPRFRVYQRVFSGRHSVLFWNHRNPLFAETSVRKALTLAINRRELYQLLNYPAGTPICDASPSFRQLTRRDFPDPIPYDPVSANRLLDAAGWDRRNQQGIRERNGKAFDFNLVCDFGSSDGHGEAVVYIQAALKRVGVRMNIRPLDEADVNRRVKDGDYEAAIGTVNIYGASSEASVDGTHLRQPFDAAGYVSPKLIGLFGRLWRAVDPDEVDRVLRDIAALFQQDVPATFLFPPVATTVASTRIRGEENCNGEGDITGCMESLWLEGAG